MYSDFYKKFQRLTDDEFVSWVDGKLMYLGTSLRCMRVVGKWKVYGHRIPGAIYQVGYYIVDTSNGEIYQADAGDNSMLNYIKIGRAHV